jgi:GR25 family glycosyltransferase involved in LPS biosynthesis
MDKIVYINLNKREDRREKITQELDNFGLTYERFEAIETPGFGILGCGLSHLKVLENARADITIQNILILEDDFTFLVTKEEFYKEIKSFFELELSKSFDVCFISYAIYGEIELDNGIVNRTLRSGTASGYIVNSRYFDTLIELLRYSTEMLAKTKEHWHYANDIVWYSLQAKDNWYYFKKRLGKQAADFSDNTGAFADYGV